MTPLPHPKAHILVVDDDLRLRQLLQQYLSQQGYAVSIAEDAAQAGSFLTLMRPDLMVLDVMMPGLSGIAFAQQLQTALNSAETPPILMLTARGDAQDRIDGLEAGVEDYLTKPFEPRELVLRIQKILRHTKQHGQSLKLAIGPYMFDRSKAQLSASGGEVMALTEAELTVLSLLAEKAGTPVSREQLATALHSDDHSESRYVDVQIGRLRKKLDTMSHAIRTIRGKGYQLMTGAN